MKQGLGLLGLVAIVLFSAQTVSRDRANVGPTPSTSTLPYLAAGVVDAGAILDTGTLNVTGLITMGAGFTSAGSSNMTSGATLTMAGGGSSTGNVITLGNNSADRGVLQNAIGASTASTTIPAFDFVQTNGALDATDLYMRWKDNTSTNILTYTPAGVLNLVPASPILQFTSVPVLAGTTPTISSGFGSSPSVTAGKAYAFRVNVGTGGVATSGVIALATTATTGWNCTCTDITTKSATVFYCKQTADSTTTVTIGNFNTSGAAAAWVASDILAVSCVGF